MPTANLPPSEGVAIAAPPGGPPPAAGALASIAPGLNLTLDATAPAVRRSGFRWVILLMVFFAITINYIDRMVIGLIAPDHLKQPNGPLSEVEFGYIGTAFGVAYALGQAGSGRWLDWIGVRVGYAIALAGWSVASMLHALVRTSVGFGLMRALLGVTESPAYPAANKTLAEWFPKKERALAMGVANAGANLGAILALLIVPPVAKHFGWQATFLVTGGIGLVWLVAWIPLYRRPEAHPRVNAAELAHIRQDPPEPTAKIRWRDLLGYPQAWAFMLSKALTDPVWSFFLFWLPSFLKKNFGVTGTGVMLPTIVAYVLADVGAIVGGWASSLLIHRGWSVNGARKATLLACAVLVVPVVFAPFAADMWTAVLLVGLALAAHQGFSSNQYTLVSDMFPKAAVGSVSGLGGTFGYLGFGLFSAVTGWVLELNGQNYIPIFAFCAAAYLVAFGIIHTLAPRMDPATFREEPGFDVVPAARPPRA